MNKRILLSPVQTEKALILQNRRNQYTFRISLFANKIEVKHAIENKYSVKVKSVRTLNQKGNNILRYTKKRRIVGRTSNWKKAIITLEAGNSINFFGDV